MATAPRTSRRVSKPVTYNLDQLTAAASDGEEDERYVSDAASDEPEMSVDAVVQQVKSDSEDEFTLTKEKKKKVVKKTGVARSRKPCPFYRLPLEILSMILSELHPSALYHLAFSSKHFYALLSSEAARSIWRQSRENNVYKSSQFWSEGDAAKDIGVLWEDDDGETWRLITWPDPTDYTDLAFAHLCFSSHCWICGVQHNKSIALFALGIRACIKCRRDHLLLFTDICKLGQVYRDLLPCLPYVMKDGAADDPDNVMAHRFWDTQVDRLRLRLYDVERTKSLEGNLSIVPYPATEDARSPPGSPLSALSDDEEIEIQNEGLAARSEDPDALRQKFYEHESDRVTRLQTFATICQRVQGAEITENLRAKRKKREDIRDQRENFREAFIEHAAAMLDVQESQIETVLKHAGPKTKLDNVLWSTKTSFTPEHYRPFDEWMTSRIAELVPLEAEYHNWHEHLFQSFRTHIVNAPSFSGLVRDTEPNMPRINEANFFAFPSMQTLFGDFEDFDWTRAELRRTFLSARAEISRDIEAFGDRVRADLLAVTQAARSAFIKKNKATLTLPSDAATIEGVGFVCRMCDQPLEGYPGILLHGCIDIQQDCARPQAPPFWRRSWDSDKQRPKLWDAALVTYDVQRSRAAWAIWKAMEDHDANLASTCASFNDVYAIAYTCDDTCDAEPLRNARADTMFHHLLNYNHTAEDWCSADTQDVLDFGEDLDDDV